MFKKIDIFVTLGPSSLNKQFLTFINRKVSLVRLNMSHVNVNKLAEKIKYIKKFCTVPICIDTEGAQVRIKYNKKKFFIKKNSIINIFKKKFFLNLYPDNVFDQLKVNDILDVGFEGLKFKVKKTYLHKISLKCINAGYLENNKGVHVSNRKIKLKFITDKDLKAIKISKELKVNNFALSFTNTKKDIENFCKILPKENKFFKIETKESIKNLNLFFKTENNFLIDRGDLSKEVGIENIPPVQRKIFKLSNKRKNTKIFIATNFLESMILKPYPTRAEVNDIYNGLEMGAKGLVLAGETAMGKYPMECVKLILKIVNVFKKLN